MPIQPDPKSRSFTIVQDDKIAFVILEEAVRPTKNLLLECLSLMPIQPNSKNRSFTIVQDDKITFVILDEAVRPTKNLLFECFSQRPFILLATKKGRGLWCPGLGERPAPARPVLPPKVVYMCLCLFPCTARSPLRTARLRSIPLKLFVLVSSSLSLRSRSLLLHFSKIALHLLFVLGGLEIPKNSQRPLQQLPAVFILVSPCAR